MSAMKTRIAILFDKVHTEEEVKDKTLLRLRKRMEQRPAGKKRASSRLAAAFCVFILMITLGGYAIAVYQLPAAYIDMDVNPSFELVVNRFGRIISSKAYNADGEKVLSSTNIAHKTYEKAITILFDFIVDDQNSGAYGLVAITVQSFDTDNAQEMVSDLNAIVDTMLKSHHANASKDIFAVSDETKTHASRCHMTPAKYLAIEQLLELDSAASFDECAMHTVGELRDYIGEHAGGHHCSHEQTHDSNKTNDPSVSIDKNTHCGGC